MARRALISVYNKKGLEKLGPGLQELGFDIISTGGTKKFLEQSGVKCREVAKITGQAELFSGRVKTLHPAIHAGILARRNNPGDMEELEKTGFGPIDLVIVNLYPFAAIRRGGGSHEEILENIDIGGPTMIRAAAKNYSDVLVVVDPETYPWILEKLKGDKVTLEDRKLLARKAFAHTASYELEIADYFAPEEERVFPIRAEKVRDLRYGENPQQKASLYAREKTKGTVVGSKLLSGKPLSYNNLLDTEAAWQAVLEFPDPAWVLVKHGNPCGLSTDEDSLEALKKARQSDPVSAFGSVVAANSEVKEREAKNLAEEQFVEVLIAPAITSNARKVLQEKWKNIRLLEAGGYPAEIFKEPEIRSVLGGFLVQDRDRPAREKLEGEVVTSLEPSQEEMEELLFAWQAAKHVKSNAILLSQKRATVGIGAGQMSRVDATRMAIWKAGKRAKGSFLASDAFIPFPDTLELAHKAGVKGIIQPGGAKRDEEVIAAADRLGLLMVFTGRRHFRH